jgi:hypothetical protein
VVKGFDMTVKENFTNKLETFVASLKSHISTHNNQWTVKGFIDFFKIVYTISSFPYSSSHDFSPSMETSI